MHLSFKTLGFETLEFETLEFETVEFETVEFEIPSFEAFELDSFGFEKLDLVILMFFASSLSDSLIFFTLNLYMSGSFSDLL